MGPGENGLPGFPEWLPSQIAFERHLIRAIAEGFEEFGFTPLDTAAVQPFEVLLAGGAQYSDGGMAKPIFDVLEPDETSTGRRFGLRYDLTVPLARYLSEHGSDLVYPLRCYQINKVWRAERPTASHWREFYQCDIDIIGRGELSPLYDAEIAAALVAAFDRMGVGEFTIRISNRLVLAALLAGHGLHNDRTRSVVHIIDEGGRQPREETVAQLVAADMPAAVAEDVGRLLACRTVEEARELLTLRRADHRGLDELDEVMAALSDLGVPDRRICLDFSITRGHDYYTGTVYETFAAGHEDWGAIGSGGRYDDLLGHVMGSVHPGVGVSIGLTRLCALLADQATAWNLPGGPATILVMTDVSGDSQAVLRAARALREAGQPTQVIFDAASPKEGLRIAESLNVPLVVQADAGGHLTLRHMRNGSSQAVDLAGLVALVRDGRAL